MKLIGKIDREDRFKKLPIDFVVVAGDATFRGSEWEHRIYNKTRSLIKWPILTAMGNHDDDDDKGETTKYFKKYISAKKLSFSNPRSYFFKSFHMRYSLYPYSLVFSSLCSIIPKPANVYDRSLLMTWIISQSLP